MRYRCHLCKLNPSPSTVPAAPASLRPPKAEAFIGIDFHKRYSVYHVLDLDGLDLAKGCINPMKPGDFAELVGRWQRPRVVFEASMNCLRASGSAVRLRYS